MGLKHDQNRERATQQIEAVRSMAKTGSTGAAIEYRGLTAGEMYALQRLARETDVGLKVIRNRLASRALQGTAFACFQSILKGPILLAFTQQSPGTLARLLRDFSKQHSQFVVKYLAFEGELLSATNLDTVANLPTKEEAIAQLLFALETPVHQFLRVVKEPQLRLLRILMAAKKA